MQELALELNTKINHWDAKQVIQNDKVDIHFFPDERGFGYITCRLYDESLIPILEKIMDKYKEKW